MKLQKLVILLLINISCLASAQEIDYYFKHFDIQKGLSQNTVQCIHQDSKGFMWFGTKDGLNRFDGYTFKTFKRNENQNSLDNSTIYCITEDADMNLWIGTDKGIYKYDSRSETFSHFDVKTKDNYSVIGNVRSIKIDKKGLVWILTGIQVFVYSPEINELELLNQKAEKLSRNAPSAMCVDDEGIAWIYIAGYGIIRYDKEKNKMNLFYAKRGGISTIIDYQNNFLLVGTVSNGLLKINKQNGQVEEIALSASEKRPFIRVIKQISENEIWIGTETGIYIYSNKGIKHLYHKPYDNFSLSDNAVYDIYKDQEDGIWVGTFFGGINYVPKQYSFFEKYYPLAKENSISGDRVREFCEDEQGNLWIATEDAGLNYFNTKTKQFSYISEDTRPISISYYNIQCLNIIDGKLWLGTFSKGIDVIDLKTKAVKHYEKTDKENSLDNNDVFSIFADRIGTVWIGTSSGVLSYDKKGDGFIRHKELGILFISDIIEDHNGYLWFATYNIGAIRYNPRTQDIKTFSYNSRDTTTISYDKITSIFEDSKKRLWFSSEDGGFCIFNEKDETFKRVTTKDGLPSNVVHKILEDNNNAFWISTNDGLAHYNPETNEVSTFNSSNGILSKQFNYKSGIRSKDGKLYFGGINGFIAFNPANFKKNKYLPDVVLTGFQIFNQEVNASTKDSPLKESISFIKTIRLNYKQSSFSFDFSSLSYTASEMNKYAYRLDGVNKDWIYLDKKTTVSYSNITPGKYTFRVKASNSNEEWSNKETSVEIIITPPWWQTPLMYIIYILLISSGIYYAITYNLNKIRKKNQRKQELLERQKKEEIYTAKIDFFTNIAHEVRTPLTLIKAPLDYILQSKVDEKELNDNLKVMERNTDRLLNLINQLLDFRKIESKVFSLNFERTNIKDLIMNAYIRFEAVAKQKKLDMNIALPEGDILASVDPEALTKVCSNLFNNAIKYADSFIHITVSVYPEHDYFQIRVNNDGNTIPMELRDKIFEAFFQIKDTDKPAKSGSGIGLTLASSLVQLHKGRIYIDNDMTECTSFVVQVPLNKEAIKQTKQEAQPTKQNTDTDIVMNEPVYSDKSTILIVEDNEELQLFLSDRISRYYQVIRANNGVEALTMMDKHIVSLVISDVIMPLMDGFELCKTIKSNLDSSHIPVVLLTAKTNLGSKIEGLKSGADAYIEKPFSMPHLLVQITNLLENRENLRKNFANNPFITTNTIAQTKADEQFLNKLTEVVMQNIEEENFNVDNLADAMNMSRTSLHRKIKGVSELTPGDFIRLVRLKKAAELLQEREYRINEICILVGFHSQSYFTKSFQKQFGVLPKDFGKKTAEEK